MSPENHPAFRNPELPMEQRLDDLRCRLSNEKNRIQHRRRGSRKIQQLMKEKIIPARRG